MKIAVTGATGFIGSAIVARLSRQGHLVRAIGRRVVSLGPGVEFVFVPDLQAPEPWASAFERCDAVIHCAGISSVPGGTASDELQVHRINVLGTKLVARACIDAGVKHFVFLSSAKVLGERTSPGHALGSDTEPSPSDSYSKSKWEAEKLVLRASANSGLRSTILRPAAVYGPGGKGNISALAQLISRGIPLPVGKANNLRSFSFVENLLDVIELALRREDGETETFLVSDDQDMSVRYLAELIAQNLGKHGKIWSPPTELVRIFATLVRKPGVYSRLFDNFQVDVSRTKRALSWTPASSVEDAMRVTMIGQLGGGGESRGE